MAKGLVVGNLRVALGLDTAEFDDGVARVNRDSKGLANNLRSGLGGAASQVAAAANGLKASLLGIGFAGMAAAVVESTRQVASLNDEAKRSGLSLKAFQEWKFVAEQNRVGLDAMVDGFKELQLRADEFIVTGGGSAAEAFQRLGYSAEDLKSKLEDPSALMLEIIDRLGRLDSAAQIRIFDELLGGSGGEQFVQLIDQGSTGLRKTIDRAHELGRVLGKDVVDAAADVDREFNEILGTMQQWLQSELVQFARDVRGAYEDIKAVYDIAVRARDALRDEGDRSAATNESRLNDIFSERLALVQKIAEEREAVSQNSDLAISLGFNEGAQNTIATLQTKIDQLNAEEDRLIAILTSNDPNYASGGVTYGPPRRGGFRPPAAQAAPPATNGGGSPSPGVSQTDLLAGRIEGLQQSLMTEHELEEQSYAKRMADLALFYEGKEGLESEWRDLSLRAQQDYADRMNAISDRQAQQEQRIRDMTWQGVSDTLGSLSQLAEQFGEKGFLAAKAFGIGQAVVNTAVGVTEALKLPPPANFAVAAAVAAAGAAQIATIASSRPGGSSRPSVPYSSVAEASPAGSTDSASRAPAYVEIKGGDLFTREQVITLLGQMSDLMGDGYELKF